jgi:two-component system cell cycle sensor histidine kinase/response regulator CckA
VGLAFYQYVTVSMVHALRKQAILTADEISRVLIFPLYTLNDAAAINSAMVYISSGRLYGIRLVSEASGVLFDNLDTTQSFLPPIKRDITNDGGMKLGSMTLVMDDSDVNSAQKTTFIIISSIVLGIIIVYALTLHLLFNRILIKPINRIISGIQQFGNNNFQDKIEEIKYDDLNQMVDGLNTMAQNIHVNQMEILESQKKYSSIFNSSFVAILLCNPQGKVLDVNETARTMLHADSRSDLLGINIEKLFASEYNDNSFNSILDNQETVGLSSRNWQAKYLNEKNSFYIEIAIKRMRLYNDDYLVVNFIDITARKDAEEKLIQAQKMEAIGLLAGGLAHDFNNVLGGITGHASLLKFKHAQNRLTDDDVTSSIEQIEASAMRASNVINRLLTFSKKHSMKPSIVDVNEIVTNVINITGKSIDKSIEVTIKPHTDKALIHADATQIEQVLLNLLVNAAHAMTIMRDQGKAWGGTLSVNVTKITNDDFFRKSHLRASEEEYWCIQVADTGVGINKTDLLKIYVPFYSTKETKQGTGLGLSMVFNIMDKHNGFIDVCSEAGVGSTFNLFLPVYQGSQIEKSTSDKESNLKGDGVILIIDDDDSIRETTKELLVSLGYEVLTAMDGSEGVDVFKSNHSDITTVILDMVMPKLSGKETFLEIKKISLDAKVILVSGFQHDERIQDLMEMGIKAFVQKPFTIEHITEAITQVTQSDKMGSALN